MALSANEVMKAGFVVDSTTGSLATTTTKTAAAWRAGFLRDPDGRLVVAS